MAEAIAFNLAADLIAKLTSPALSQISLLWNLKDDLDNLKSIVSSINAVLLDAEEQSVTNNSVKDWLEKLKDALYDADDLLDDFSTQVLRKDLLSGNMVTKEVRLFFSSSNQFAYGLKMGHKIKAIKARFNSIENETKLFNLVKRNHPVETPFMTKRRQQVHSFVREGEIIGRDDDKVALLKLMFESQTEENVFVVPIVGIGGLGKTALAQLVYNDEMVIDHFGDQFRMWVCVSDVFDLKIIVANIIKSITNQAPDPNLELDQLQKQLRARIDGEKYLLVLDDIWNEEWEKWVSLKKLLMGGAKGSRIIVTTRSVRVAKITSKCEPHNLKGLADDDAWSLFKQIAFEQRSADSTNPAFVGIGKQILKKCCGVPLLIRTIAGTLSYKETENEWLSFKDNELARISQGDILPILQLSYDHLPSHLKHCFAYCRLFPKGHEINVQTLIQYWIAQGFVRESNSNQSPVEIGLGYFKDLVERSLFQEVVVGKDDGLITCKIHDLMHDLAKLVAGTESFILNSNSNLSAREIDEKCRHISILPSLIPLFKGKKLRSLLRFESMIENMSDETWDFIISNCRCLRVLELYASNLSSVPHTIYKLKHLRYFDLSYSLYLKKLPKSICKLQNLQVLKLDDCSCLEELPEKIEKLVNLTHLPLGECVGLTHMPRGIGKLTSLETLSMFVVDPYGSRGGADLSELGGLNNLRGELRISNLGFVKNAKEEFKSANLKGKQHLRSLVLEWSANDDGERQDRISLLQAYEEYIGHEKSLEDLQPHPNLKKLCVRGWRSDAKFPNWLSLLTNLVEITIVGPSKFKQLPSFAQLPHLQQLWISDLSELEYMEDNGPNGDSESFFPSLTSLKLCQCPKMNSWWRKRPTDDDDNYNEDNGTVIGISTVAFPCLSLLWIENCPLTSMPLYSSLDDELRLVNTSSRPLKQTIQMNMISSSTSSITPSSSNSSLPFCKLKSFRVESIEELDPDMLDECLQNMTLLEGLDIGSCHWLKSLSGCLQRLTSLKKLGIRDCKELDLDDTQWETLKNLSSLEIDNIPKMVSLPLWLQHLVQLKLLTIQNCSGLRSLFPVFQHLTSLEWFEVSNCKELELSAAGNGIQIFQDNTSLRSLTLKTIPKCQHLPEWLQHLTNLQQLQLFDLPNLTSLPDELCSLANLEMLGIIGSPLLSKRCRRDIGADWHKIAHIAFVFVNEGTLLAGLNFSQL